MKRCGWIVASLILAFVVTGCASYYRVVDPQSGKTYYTQEVETIKSGAVKVKDARTGSIVTLQSSEVKEISEKEYKAGLTAPATPPPAPAAEEAAPPAPAAMEAAPATTEEAPAAVEAAPAAEETGPAETQ